jgi:hypothetical protein
MSKKNRGVGASDTEQYGRSKISIHIVCFGLSDITIFRMVGGKIFIGKYSLEIFSNSMKNVR